MPTTPNQLVIEQLLLSNAAPQPFIQGQGSYYFFLPPSFLPYITCLFIYNYEGGLQRQYFCLLSRLRRRRSPAANSTFFLPYITCLFIYNYKGGLQRQYFCLLSRLRGRRSQLPTPGGGGMRRVFGCGTTAALPAGLLPDKRGGKKGLCFLYDDRGQFSCILFANVYIRNSKSQPKLRDELFLQEEGPLYYAYFHRQLPIYIEGTLLLPEASPPQKLPVS